MSRILPQREVIESPTEIENRIRRHFRINQRSAIRVTVEEHVSPTAGTVEINGRPWLWRLAPTGLELRHRSGGTAVRDAGTFAHLDSLSDREIERRNTTTRFALATFTAVCLIFACIGRMVGLFAAPIGYLTLACGSATFLILHCASRADSPDAAEAAPVKEQPS